LTQEIRRLPDEEHSAIAFVAIGGGPRSRSFCLRNGAARETRVDSV